MFDFITFDGVEYRGFIFHMGGCYIKKPGRLMRVPATHTPAFLILAYDTLILINR